MPQTKQEKPLGERFKDFFKSRSSSKSEISAESLSSISADQPVSCRLQAIKELQGLVKEKKIQQNCVEQLWLKVSDLLETSQEKETRHAVLDFIIDLVTSQYPSLDIMRLKFFGLVKKHTVDEDVNHRIRLLEALTEEGNNINHFEEEVGSVVVQLLRQSTEQLADCSGLLSLTTNLINSNASHLSPETVIHLIGILSSHACNTKRESEISMILEVYKSLVQYTTIPSEAVLQFTACLCRVVNIEQVRLDALITMRSLLGTQLGQTSLGDLCSLIQSSPDQQEDELLIRGACFFLGSCLWGPHNVASLNFSTVSILPVFLVALKDGQPQVVAECSAQVLSLVQLQGAHVTKSAYALVLDIIRAVYKALPNIQDDKIRLEVESNIQNTVATIDELITKNKFTGDREDLCNLIETMCHLCPDSAVVRLISLRCDQNIRPSNEEWVDFFESLMTKYYDEELRPAVRVQMLSLLQTTLKKNLSSREDHIINKLVLPFLSDLNSEVDRTVKIEAVLTVSELAAESVGNHLTDLLDILENILKRLTSLKTEGEAETEDQVKDKLPDEDEFLFFHEAVKGIVKVFKSKFWYPPIHAVKRCYEILVTLLDRFYSIPGLLNLTGNTRYEIFRCFLSLRAKQDYRLGYYKECRGCVIFSPFVVCESKQGYYPKDKDMLVLSLTRACRAVIRCFREDNDWRVLQLLLSEVPSILQNRGILLRYEESISKLAEALCGLVQSSYRLPEKNIPPKFTRTDFNLTVYPVLASLGSYNRWLNSEVKRMLIQSLESGLLSKECSKVCTVALTSCILEMSNSMNSFLPDVLIHLSKISATVHVAIPVLEFLSTLITLPKVFASFNNQQYMSVFAITLPFTNPFKFNHYTVSLAHHVIIMWFLKCRVASRKDFVQFIVKGLEGNALQPFEEGNFRKRDLAAMNEDSSNRGRSSSLNEESRPSRTRHMTGVPSRPQLHHKPGPDERQALHTFHQELTQTCIDMMTRYVSSNPSAESDRTLLANLLLKSGTSSSWLIDSAVLTISVSSCSGTTKGGAVCQSCSKGCEGAEGLHELSEKKRHFSEQPVRTRIQPPPAPLHQDDALLHDRSKSLLHHVVTPQKQKQQPTAVDSTQQPSQHHSSGDLRQIRRRSNDQQDLEDFGSLEDLRNLNESVEDDDQCGGCCQQQDPQQHHQQNGGLNGVLSNGDKSDAETPSSPVHVEDKSPNLSSIQEETGSSPGSLAGDSCSSSSQAVLENGSNTASATGGINSGKPGGDICPCWCQGWCEILIRRPSGEMSWMCRLRNGHLTNNNFTLQDISSILFPDSHVTQKIKVNRSNSDPEILDKLTPLDLNKMKSLQICDPIPEEDNSPAARTHRRPRSNTIDSSSPTKPVKRMDRLLLATQRIQRVTPELMLDQVLASAGLTLNDLAPEQCLLLPKSRQFDTSLKLLDMIPYQETHKIGVLYVGPGQANKETEILGNTKGSDRYQEFVSGLGSLISLEDGGSNKIFLGGLSHKDGDGDSAYVWLDDAMQVVYHTATLMPNRENDPQFNKKKRHIGNDYVAIVYNESGDRYQMGTVKGHFIYATVVVEPLDFESNRITVLAKPELATFLSHLTQGKVVSDWNLSILVRQIALHCNLAANIYSNIENKQDLYASNWLERLRHIKRLKTKIQKEQEGALMKDYNII